MLQEALEAEMGGALGAANGKRTPKHVCYRVGYYSRTVLTCIGCANRALCA